MINISFATLIKLSTKAAYLSLNIWELKILKTNLILQYFFSLVHAYFALLIIRILREWKLSNEFRRRTYTYIRETRKRITENLWNNSNTHTHNKNKFKKKKTFLSVTQMFTARPRKNVTFPPDSSLLKGQDFSALQKQNDLYANKASWRERLRNNKLRHSSPASRAWQRVKGLTGSGWNE